MERPTGQSSGLTSLVKLLSPSPWVHLGKEQFATIVVGGTTAVIASAMTAEPSVKAEPISVTAETVVQAAPDNFWTLLGELVSVGGWALLLVVLVPMLFSWLMPGPVQFKTKK